jgi:hypothetical protein
MSFQSLICGFTAVLMGFVMYLCDYVVMFCMDAIDPGKIRGVS